MLGFVGKCLGKNWILALSPSIFPIYSSNIVEIFNNLIKYFQYSENNYYIKHTGIIKGKLASLQCRILADIILVMWSSENITSACVLSRFSHVWLCATLQTVARQGPLSMGFSRQEYWNRLPFPSPGDLFNPGNEVTSFTSPALAREFFTTSATWETQTSPVIIDQPWVFSGMMLWEGHITSVVSFPIMHNINLIMRKCQTNPNWGTFCKITD